MRKDKGLSGDLDRLPMLVWVMFLKFIDDMEMMREEEAILKGEKFRPAIAPPYRWRDWASPEDGITGDSLIAFINQDRATLPGGGDGPGLFAYLRSLTGSNGGDRRDVIATVFRGTVNRMISGYLLRDLINKINSIHFSSSEEIHTLSHLYESMLKEMRDAAGDSGEFYTPRPVIRFMVAVTDPRLGETFLDPACGTGGFLVETFKHLFTHCNTVEDGEVLQRHSIFGGEAKPLPYMLCQMNLLLHGLEFPQIDSENSLRYPLREIGYKDRVDVILTNPPFGGEEERGILSNFPEDKQTSETALLFLQLIMRKLSRPPTPGRAGVVVPNGTLFGDGVAARIKEELLREFNLHTIIRLPNGVLPPTPAFPPTCYSSTAPGRQRRSGTTRWLCLRAGRTTPRLNRCSSRSLPTAWPGGRTARRARGPGECPRSRLPETGIIWISRIPTGRRILSNCRRRSWWRAYWPKKSGSCRSWARSKGCWRRRDDRGKFGRLCLRNWSMNG
jgi:type I restriction enzyme M protein